MAIKKNKNVIAPQGELNTELSSEMKVENSVTEVVAKAEQVLEEMATDAYSDLRSHERNYVAANKRAHEAIVSVCFAKTGKRVTLSVKQLKNLIDYGKEDWLDIKYSDSTNTVLIGKSEGAYGVAPIANEKKYIIYDSLTVKDFKDTLYLDFGNCSSHSAYSYKMVQLNGRPYIALAHSDFI